jgi:PKD repeat protein
MKTHKRFVISGMSKRYKIRGTCLVLVALIALIATTAQAQETEYPTEYVFVDPGTPGEPAPYFAFELMEPERYFDYLFKDFKTLEWEAGYYTWIGPGLPWSNEYAGALLDEAGNEIPGTVFQGQTAKENDPFAVVEITLDQKTVFSGVRIYPLDVQLSMTWEWTGDSRPLVGQTDASGNLPPVADAGGPYMGTTGVKVWFDGRASFDPDGDAITQYDWDFGDDLVWTDSPPEVPHTYTSAGTYNVILTVTDIRGVTNSATVTATITLGPPPTIDAGGPYTEEVGENVLFNALPDGGTEPYQYDWDYGDGNSASDVGPKPSHSYESTGEYTVTVTVTDANDLSGSDTATATITIGNQAPSADAGDPVIGEPDTPVTFDGSGSSDPDGTIERYEWDFGDPRNSAPGTGATTSHAYEEPGSYTATLTVTDDKGATDSHTTSAFIGSPDTPPTADAGGPYSGTAGVEVSFDGSASVDQDGTIERYDWDFGDSSTGTGATPTHTYAAAGSYTVTLTVTDEDDLTNSDIAQATITTGNQPPTADPNGPYGGKAGEAVTFEGSGSSDDVFIDQYDWDFGDGNSVTDAGKRWNHTYEEAGTYTVTLTVTDDAGLSDTETTSAEIEEGNQAPTADAGDPVIGQPDTPVTFDGSGSEDPDGTIEQYNWDFGDRTLGEDDGGAMPTHTYERSGNYTVTLTVTDNHGTTSAETFTTASIDSPNAPPVADANGPYAGKVGVRVDFDGKGSEDPDGIIDRYDWDFGDGNSSARKNPNHAYTGTGAYDVVLTVTDNDGSTAKSATRAIIGDGVNLPPTADPGGPYNGDEGATVAFDGSASTDPDDTIADYAWDFGDANTGSGPKPSHTYAEAGMYLVTLTVTDAGGKSDTQTTVAAIGMGNLPLTADASGLYGGAAGVPMPFDSRGSSDPDGTIVAWDWDFGDGNGDTGRFPIYTYTSPGLYQVILTVTDNEGATDQSTATVIITSGNVPPVADAAGPYTGVAGAPVSFDGSASTDPDGTITDYDWTFGDGLTGTGPMPDGTITDYDWTFGDGLTGTGLMPDNTYAAGGLYSVILQVTDEDGLTASDNARARIGDFSLPPTADAGGPYPGRVGVAVSFDGTASSDPDPDGTIVRYDWSFGDNTILNDAGAMPTHTYAASGKYIVKLTVTDDSGETDTDTTVATAGRGNLPPLADAGDSVSGKAQRDINFDGTRSKDLDGNIVSYAWNFGDSNTGTGPNPTHSYADAGKYLVTLTVTDSDGAVNSDATLAEVEEKSGGGGGGGGSCFITTAMGQ